MIKLCSITVRTTYSACAGADTKYREDTKYRKKLNTEQIHFTQKTQGKENTQRTVETRVMEYIKGESKGVDYDRKGT